MLQGDWRRQWKARNNQPSFVMRDYDIHLNLTSTYLYISSYTLEVICFMLLQLHVNVYLQSVTLVQYIYLGFAIAYIASYPLRYADVI